MVFITLALVIIETVDLLFAYKLKRKPGDSFGAFGCGNRKINSQIIAYINKSELSIGAFGVFRRMSVNSSSGTLTGRTLAAGQALCLATFALSILGHGSPALGVVVGPFVYMAFLYFCQHIVRNGLCRGARFLLLNLQYFKRPCPILPRPPKEFKHPGTSLVITGPMPSPHTPIIMVSSWRSLQILYPFILSACSRLALKVLQIFLLFAFMFAPYSKSFLFCFSLCIV